METRLRLLETAIEKLFPNGEVDATTYALLMDNLPENWKSSTETNDQVSLMGLPEPDGQHERLVDDNMQSLLLVGWNKVQTKTGTMEQPSNLEESLSPNQSQDNTPVFVVEEGRIFVDSYFSHYHVLNPFLHESTFRAMYERVIPIIDQNAWPVLMNMVLSFGAWLYEDDTGDADKKYYAVAKHHLKNISMFDKGNLTMVQALLLLSDFAQKQGDPEESWQYVGGAVRMAISLDLHLEPVNSDSSLTLLEKEMRRRVWWTTYCFESCSSKVYGRPLLLPEDSLMTVKPVSNIPDTVRCTYILFSSFYSNP